LAGRRPRLLPGADRVRERKQEGANWCLDEALLITPRTLFKPRKISASEENAELVQEKLIKTDFLKSGAPTFKDEGRGQGPSVKGGTSFSAECRS